MPALFAAEVTHSCWLPAGVGGAPCSTVSQLPIITIGANLCWVSLLPCFADALPRAV